MELLQSYLPYINTGIISFGFLIAFLKWLAPKTGTLKDDEIVKYLDDKSIWLKNNVYPIYFLIEEAAHKNNWTSVLKWTEFLRVLSERYNESFKTPMPQYLETTANLMVSTQAVVDKVKKLPEDLKLNAEQLKSQLTGDVGPFHVAKE